MTDKREAAMRQALEEMKRAHDASLDGNDFACRQILLVQITTLTAALEQPAYRAVKTFHEGKPVYVSEPAQGAINHTKLANKALREAMNRSADIAKAAQQEPLTDEQAALLRECRAALDSLIAQKPTLAGLLCGSTTLGNLRAELGAYRPQGVFGSRPQAREPLTPREIELIDGMIEVQLHHAQQCDRIANRTMADKQKGWDMERVELLRKLKAAHKIGDKK